MFNRAHAPFLTTLFLLAAAAPLAAQQLEIVEAAYGSGNYQMNVAPKLRGLVQNNVLEFTVDPGLLGGDPAPGSSKRLRVVYRYGGRQSETSAGDFERIRIPALAGSGGVVSPVTPTPAAASGGGFSLGDLWGGNSASLRIVSARYGDPARSNDVRDRLQNLVRNDALSLKVDNAAMGGDPAVARDKTLQVVYEYRGTTFQTAVKEGATLTLPDSNARAVSTATPVAAAAPVTAATSSQQSIRIVTARYGGDNRFNDVRDRLQAMAGSGGNVSVKVENAALGGDPAVGKEKWLEVAYEWNGSTYATHAKEGQTLSLPDPQAMLVSNVVAQPAPTAAPVGRGADTGGGRNAGRRPVGGPIVTPSGGREIIPIGRTGGLRIFYARYGAPGQEIDVREQLRPLLQPEALNITVGVDAMGGDPAPGVLKTITVIYELRGRTFEKSASDGQTLILP